MNKLAVLLIFLIPWWGQVHAAVVINEFQVEPSGASQWVEILNTGPDTHDTSGWFVDDNGGTEKFTIPSNTVLPANTCVSFASGNFNWNTVSSDSARLINGSIVVDEYAFSGSPGSGVSFGRSPDGTGGFTTFSSPTRDRLNATGGSCLPPPIPTPTPTPTPTVTPTPTATPPAKQDLALPDTPTPTPTKTPTPTPTKISTPTPTPSPPPAILGVQEEAPVSESQVETPPSQTKALIISLLLIGLGLAILSLLLLWKKIPDILKK